MMNAKLPKWMPIALCCLPGVVVAAVVGIGIAVGGGAFGTALGGPLGLSLLALAILACPVSMSLMMLRQRGSGQTSALGSSATMMDCCLSGPGEEAPTERLTALRARREALERELAELQTK